MSKITSIASYPPGFRPTHIPDLVNSPSEEPIDQPDPLPIIDMASLESVKLHAACSDWGIFRLVNHGIPESLVTSLHSAAKSIFDLDFESKWALLKDPNPVYSWGNRSLTRAQVQPPKGLTEVGLEVISFAFAKSRLCDDKDDQTAITHFRNILKEYGEHMTRLAKGLFESMLRNLMLEGEADLNKYLEESSGLLRINRYPPHSTSDTELQVKGLDAHTDSTVLTILLQDDVNGLEFCNDGVWQPVKPVSDTLIVNLGDMLQAMSDDKYKSVEHKVMLNERRARISVGYFVFPEENTLVSRPKGKYKPFTYKDFRTQVHEDVAEIGWKVGLSRFRA